MTRLRDERLFQRTGVLLALLCPVAWFYTGWHLAIEAHHDHPISAVEAHHDHPISAVEAHHDHYDHPISAVEAHDDDHHDHDDHHHHEGGAPAEDEGHHHDDHLIPDSLRPDHHGPVFAIDLELSDVVLEELAATPAPVAAPCEDVPPATDPPIDSSRPRAPPVG